MAVWVLSSAITAQWMATLPGTLMNDCMYHLCHCKNRVALYSAFGGFIVEGSLCNANAIMCYCRNITINIFSFNISVSICHTPYLMSDPDFACCSRLTWPVQASESTMKGSRRSWCGSLKRPATLMWMTSDGTTFWCKWLSKSTFDSPPLMNLGGLIGRHQLCSNSIMIFFPRHDKLLFTRLTVSLHCVCGGLQNSAELNSVVCRRSECGL